MSGARRAYEDFNGRKPKGNRKVTMNVPDVLTQLGNRVVAIEYESDKLNGGGDGKRAVYRHVFDRNDVLLYDPVGRWLFITGPRLKVTSRGIEN